MADTGNGGLTLPRSLNVNTIIILASVFASFWAQWALLGERNAKQQQQLDQMAADLSALNTRYYSLQSDFIKVRVQLDDLLDAYQRRAHASPGTGGVSP